MELKEALEKYGDTLLTFERYYKYSFTFSGVAKDGTRIKMITGGSSDSIYRYEVDNKPKPLREFEPDTVCKSEWGYDALVFGWSNF